MDYLGLYFHELSGTIWDYLGLYGTISCSRVLVAARESKFIAIGNFLVILFFFLHERFLEELALLKINQSTKGIFYTHRRLVYHCRVFIYTVDWSTVVEFLYTR